MSGILLAILLVIRVAGEGTPPKALLIPVSRAEVSSDFGYRHDPILRARRFHAGIDFAARAGSPVRAAGTGQVVFVGRFLNYGTLVVLRHGKDLSTHYGHLRRSSIGLGEYVKRGAIIGLVGASGRTTGPHLHFEIRLKGIPINPQRFIGE